MSEEPTIRRTFRLAQPSFVSKLIAHGSYGEIGLLRSNPSRVFKFCAIDNEVALASIEQEKKILAILGSHQYIIRLYLGDERGLCNMINSFTWTLLQSIPLTSRSTRLSDSPFPFTSDSPFTSMEATRFLHSIARTFAVPKAVV